MSLKIHHQNGFSIFNSHLYQNHSCAPGNATTPLPRKEGDSTKFSLSLFTCLV